MLRSKRGNLIISLILAMILWVYVVGELNPTTTKTFRDIPITFVNETVLADEGLSVVKTSSDSLNITLSGRRSAIKKITTSDLRASVDLADAAEGENQLRIQITTPSSVEVKEQGLTKITVQIERSITEEKSVHVNYTGDPDSDIEPTTVQVSPKTVRVTGAAEQVKKVSYVAANVPLSELATDRSTVKSELVPMNEEGERVANVALDVKHASVTSTLHSRKIVKLKVPIRGKNQGGYVREIEVPSEITIKGDADVLDGVSEVSADPLDVSGISKEKRVHLSFTNLPSGVSISENSMNLSARIKVVSTNEEKTLSIDSTSVVIRDVPEGLSAELGPTTLKVTVSGDKKVIDKVKKKDIKLSASLAGLTDAGEYRVRVDAECNMECDSISVNPKSVKVTITMN